MLTAKSDHPRWGRPVASEGPGAAKILIVGEAPGAWEVKLNRPFVGASGSELDKMLLEAGITRSECYVTNILPWFPGSIDIDELSTTSRSKVRTDWVEIDGRYVCPEIALGLERFKAQVELVQPKVIIALGNLALWATTRNWGIKSWRGSTLGYIGNKDIIVVPAHHPSTILRQWSWRIFNIWDFRRAKNAAVERPKVPDYQFVIRPTFDQALTWITQLKGKLSLGPVALACDIETRAGHTACIGFATSSTEAICFPLMARGHAEYSYWSEQEEFVITGLLKEALTHPNIRVYGQNFSYDAQYIWRFWNFIPRLGFDTLLGSHVLFPGLEKGLDVLSSLYCEYHIYWKDDGKEWTTKMDESVLWSYNCMDCVRTFEIAERMIPLIESSGLQDQCIFLHKVWHLTLDAMIDGIRVDHENKHQLSKHLDEEAKARLKWMTELLGFEVNPKSPKQMVELFYGTFNQRIILNRKTRTPTCNDEAIARIAEREPLLRPLIKKIQEYRSISVFKSTFIDAPVDTDGRMRTQYKPAGTETFRLSSSTNAFGSGLNMQNIPSGDEDAEFDLPNVRKIFLPDPDHEIADCDLSSADLYVVVWESDEPDYKTLLRKGLDPYTEIAKEFFNDSIITKKDHRRRYFKALAHGTHYLGTPAGMAPKLALPQAEIARVQQWYYARFPGIQRWQERVVAELMSTHKITNIWGYRRVYFDRLEGTIKNQAVAWVGQSTVAIYINKIWDAIASSEAARDLGIKVSLQVHDSLVFQYPIRYAEQARTSIRNLASKVIIPYPDPLVIPLSLKHSTISWGHCK